jgi:hypothetical protein
MIVREYTSTTRAYCLWVRDFLLWPAVRPEGNGQSEANSLGGLKVSIIRSICEPFTSKVISEHADSEVAAR